MKKILFFIFILPFLFFVLIVGAIGSETQTKSNDIENGEVPPTNVTGDSEVGKLIATKGLTRLGAKYVWGGGHSMEEIKNPTQMIFDCSSFVCWSYYQGGIDIGTQTTKTLIKMGQEIAYNDMQGGDIILFKLDNSIVSHVGIYLGNDVMVHAPNPKLPVKEEKLGKFWKDSIVSCRRLY